MQQATKRKIPVRRCLGCGEHLPKGELIRVLRTKHGEVILDLTGKASGRGAYICHSLSCFRKARKAKRFESALEVSIPEEIYDRMEGVLSEA